MADLNNMKQNENELQKVSGGEGEPSHSKYEVGEVVEFKRDWWTVTNKYYDDVMGQWLYSLLEYYAPFISCDNIAEDQIRPHVYVP